MDLDENRRDEEDDDVYEAYTCPGDFWWTQQERGEIDRSGEAVAVHSRIRALYNSGTPLFTKEAIRDLGKQLQSLAEVGQKVHVRGLDGRIVEYENQTRRISPAHRPELERVLYVQ